MEWRHVSLVAVAALMLAGCGDPVVFRPITDVKVRPADLPPRDMTVRTFVGYTLSESERFAGSRAPAVAVVTSGREPERGRCRFVFFVSGMAVTIDLPIRGPVNAGRCELRGKAWDPRGWDVHWTAALAGDTVEGTFTQPHDHGRFRLREVKP